MALLRRELAQFRVWRRQAFRVAFQEEVSPELLPERGREVSHVKKQGRIFQRKNSLSADMEAQIATSSSWENRCTNFKQDKDPFACFAL